MNAAEIMAELKTLGNQQTHSIFKKHGLEQEAFGVKVADLKTIVKKVKKNHPLALELFKTGNADAMYLAGLLGDPKKVSEAELHSWTKAAHWYMVGEYMVAGLAAESPHGWKLGLEWIESEEDHVAAIGWATLAGVIAVRKDEELDLDAVAGLVDRVEKSLHGSGNRTRYTMNGFVISVGAYVVSLTERAMEAAKQIGKVSVNQGSTACKVPFAPEYLQKIISKGRVGKKKKKVRC